LTLLRHVSSKYTLTNASGEWVTPVMAAFTHTNANGNCQCWRVFVRVTLTNALPNTVSVIVSVFTLANSMTTVSLLYSASHSRTQWLQCHYCILRHTRERNGKSSLTALLSHLTKAMEIVLRCFHIMETCCCRPSFTRDYTGHYSSSISLFSLLSPSAQ